MDEMVRSVRTLEGIVRNPSLLTEIDDDMDQVDELVMERHRREVLTTPSDGGLDPNPTDGQAPAPYLGPYLGKNKHKLIELVNDINNYALMHFY